MRSDEFTRDGTTVLGRVARGAAPLLPLFLLYLAIAVIASSPVFGGDEGGYVENALRILRGPAPGQDLRLWWGPGYPLVLVPFVALRLPWIAAKAANAVFLFAAVVYFYALIRRYVPGKPALAISYCLGLYPPLMRELPNLSPESLTFFLVCGFTAHFCALFNQARRFRLHLLAASLYLAFLALTKVVFGYVIAAGILVLLLLILIKRAHGLQAALAVCGLALAWTVPYLAYTYSLTGKVFYWGTSGGMSLYWMSSPYAQESGSWFSVKDVMERQELAPHRPFFATLEGLNEAERDDAYKRRAVDNIVHHPLKYLRNCAANIGRLLFSYPFSFATHSLTTFFYLVPNMFVVVLFLLSLIPALSRPKAIPFEFWALLAFAGIAFGGSVLLSAYDRQFRPLVPIIGVWTAYVYLRVLRIELRHSAENLNVGGALATERIRTELPIRSALNSPSVQTRSAGANSQYG